MWLERLFYIEGLADARLGLRPCFFLQSEWTVELPPGEEAECLATGSQFVAVGTSSNLMRIFSPSGIQLAILTLPGPPIALAAHGHQLATVWHSGNGLDGNQNLHYAVLYQLRLQYKLLGTHSRESQD